MVVHGRRRIPKFDLRPAAHRPRHPLQDLPHAFDDQPGRGRPVGPDRAGQLRLHRDNVEGIAGMDLGDAHHRRVQRIDIARNDGLKR